MKIILIYGGKSAEHEISIQSAFSILQSIYYDYYQVKTVYITKSGTWIRGAEFTKAPMTVETLALADTLSSLEMKEKIIQPCEIKEEDAIVFPVLHGPFGEDGTIQGFLETLHMPYVGAGVLSSACGMDKIITKYILQQAGIPQVPFVPVTITEWRKQPQQIFDYCEGSLLYPMYIKPANLGSSVGISCATNREELQNGITLAFQYDRRVIVEQGIKARELEVGILGNDEVRTTLPGEIVKEVDFYDYNAKYIDQKVTLQIPADIPEELSDQAREYAEKTYTIMNGSGLARCDFFLSGNNELFLNELNTMPGFTRENSMYPLLWKNMGLAYGDLIEELIQLGLMRFKEKKQLYGVNATNISKD